MAAAARYVRVGYTARPILTACDALPAIAAGGAGAAPSTVAEAEAACDAVKPPGIVSHCLTLLADAPLLL